MKPAGSGAVAVSRAFTVRMSVVPRPMLASPALSIPFAKNAIPVGSAIWSSRLTKLTPTSADPVSQERGRQLRLAPLVNVVETSVMRR